MSIPVAVSDLNTALADCAGYLLSAAAGGRVKAVTVEPRVLDGLLRVNGPGRGSLANVGANAQVTLLFPPLAQRGYTLLVDGEAVVDGEDVLVTPLTAVLHRPAAHSDGPAAPGGCGDDCHPVGSGRARPPVPASAPFATIAAAGSSAHHPFNPGASGSCPRCRRPDRGSGARWHRRDRHRCQGCGQSRSGLSSGGSFPA